MALNQLQAATHPEARGMSYHRFMLERVTAQCNWWLGKLRRGEPVMVDGRNVTKEWEEGNRNLRETGGLCRDHTARDNYGWRSA